MQEILKISLNEKKEQVVSARELHQALGITKRFSAWWKQNSPSLIEYQDFEGVLTGTPYNSKYPQAVQKLQDYALTIDAAKHLAMQSRTAKGQEVRAYFIQVEKLWNSPEKVMERALQYSKGQIKALENQLLAVQPKVLFADSVATSPQSILVGELATYLRQNGIDIGQNRLFQDLRRQGWLSKRKGETWNLPTQKGLERGLFELKKVVINSPNGRIRISSTPKVTGKGQLYFVQHYLSL